MSSPENSNSVNSILARYTVGNTVVVHFVEGVAYRWRHFNLGVSIELDIKDHLYSATQSKSEVTIKAVKQFSNRRVGKNIEAGTYILSYGLSISKLLWIVKEKIYCSTFYIFFIFTKSNLNLSNKIHNKNTLKNIKGKKEKANSGFISL